MTKEEAATLVDAWAKEWRTYLDGRLHHLARQALIDKLSAPPAKRARGGSNGG